MAVYSWNTQTILRILCLVIMVKCNTDKDNGGKIAVVKTTKTPQDSINLLTTHPPVDTERVKPPEVYDIQMPGIKPTKEDEYWCTSMQAPAHESFITNYEAHSEGQRAHHILLFGCEKPYSRASSWKCGSICDGNEQILFAWAKNADPTRLPEGVGYQLGGPASPVQYLVLQVHYKDPIPQYAAGDKSGIKMQLTLTRPQYLAGILIMAASGMQGIPAHQEKYHMDLSCKFDGSAPIYPFAYRVHAHTLATVISGYHNNGSLHLLGKGNPNWPQAFYPMQEHHEVKPGDDLISRCTFNSMSRSQTTNIGAKHTDEMCNFYMMYYVDPDRGETYYSCEDNNLPELSKQLPPESDIPPPSNPLLEDIASGNIQGNHGDDIYESMYAKRFGSRLRDPHRYPSRGYGGGYYGGRSRFDPNAPQYYYYDDGSDGINDHDQYYYDVANQRNRNRGNAYRSTTKPTDDADQDHSDSRNEDRPYYSHRKTISRKPGPVYNRKPHTKADGLHPEVQSHPRAQSALVTSTALPVTKSTTAPRLKPSPSGIPLTPWIKEVADWPDPGVKLGQVSGIATDSKGEVHIFHRSSRTWEPSSFNDKNIFDKSPGPITEDVILTLDKDGKLVNSWGKNMFYMPHGLHIDRQDRIWLTDVALHQVMRFPAGKQKHDLILGEKFVPGSDNKHFCKPTDIATLSNGQFYITDGYCNNRVIKYAADGKFIKQWGTKSSSVTGDGFAPPGTFDLPHSVSVLEDHDLLCVADRANRRIQCFNLEGTFIRQIHAQDIKGLVFSVEFSQANGLLYAINGKDYSDQGVKVEGFAFNPLTGSLVQRWAPTSQNLQVPHVLTLSGDGQFIYVGEIKPNPCKLWKFQVQKTIIPGVTLAVKKPPSSVDQETDDKSEDALETSEAANFGASLVIGGLLIVPVIIVVTITICLRLRKSGKRGTDTEYIKITQYEDDDEEDI